MRGTLEERFWAKVDTSRGADGCWPWLASDNGKGYGQFFIECHPHRAHRVAYELVVGPIPDGLQIDHLCRNRGCVNPAHMEPVTAKVNTLRSRSVSALNAVKTHCPAGHEYSGSNLVIRAHSSGRSQRMCRECNRLRLKAKYHRLKAAGLIDNRGREIKVQAS